MVDVDVLPMFPPMVLQIKQSWVSLDSGESTRRCCALWWWMCMVLQEVAETTLERGEDFVRERWFQNRQTNFFYVSTHHSDTHPTHSVSFLIGEWVHGGNWKNVDWTAYQQQFFWAESLRISISMEGRPCTWQRRFCCWCVGLQGQKGLFSCQEVLSWRLTFLSRQGGGHGGVGMARKILGSLWSVVHGQLAVLYFCAVVVRFFCEWEGHAEPMRFSGKEGRGTVAFFERVRCASLPSLGLNELTPFFLSALFFPRVPKLVDSISSCVTVSLS